MMQAETHIAQPEGTVPDVGPPTRLPSRGTLTLAAFKPSLAEALEDALSIGPHFNGWPVAIYPYRRDLRNLSGEQILSRADLPQLATGRSERNRQIAARRRNK